MNEQPLDLKRLAQAVRRHRALVIVVFLAGICASLGYAQFRPPMPRADALVILSNSVNSSGSPAIDMSTQLIIATSTPVLGAAGSSVSPPVSASTLKDEVTASALSQDILQVKASAPTRAEAVGRANAVANQYIRYVTTDATGSAKLTLAQLRVDASALTKQIQVLQNQINAASARLAREGASSPDGQRDSAVISSLRGNQEDLSSQLDTVNNEIITTEYSGSLAAGATAILQKANIMPSSSFRVPELGVIGALAGLALGCFVALLLARGDRRLYLRDEVAAAVSIPVIASFQASPCKSVRDWLRLLRNFKPSPVDTWNTRRILYRLAQVDPEARPQLNILVLADDLSALASSAEVAKAVASLGFPVALEPAPHRCVAALQAACVVERRPSPTGTGYYFRPQAPSGERTTGSEPSGPALTVSVVVVDPATRKLPSAGATILSVSAGFSTAEMLARAALAASEAGCAIEGVVIVNPDPSDTTSGSVSNEVEPPTALSRPLMHRLSSATTVGRSK